jgi:hypothetical protein
MRTALVVPLLMLASPSWALDALELSTAGQWFMPMRDRPSYRLQAAYGWESPAAQRDDAERNLSRSGGYALLSGRVWRDDDQELVLRLGGVDVREEGDVRLPLTGELPDRVQDLRVGGFWRHAPAAGRTVFGLDAEMASPSDRPYSGSEVLSISATGFAALPSGERDAWLIGLRYDSNRSFLPGVPLPAVSYRIDRGPEWTAIIGLPVTSIEGSLAPELRGLLLWSLIDVFRAELQWIPGTEQRPFLAPWIVSTGFSQTGETWLRADRPDEDRRIQYRTMRAFVAADYQPFPGNRVRLSGGWIPYRTISESESVFDTDNRIGLRPSWFTSVALRLAY